jgi:hypothetical protein
MEGTDLLQFSLFAFGQFFEFSLAGQFALSFLLFFPLRHRGLTWDSTFFSVYWSRHCLLSAYYCRRCAFSCFCAFSFSRFSCALSGEKLTFSWSTSPSINYSREE